MSNEVAALVFAVDSSGFKTAAVDMDKLVATSEKLEDAQEKLYQSTVKAQNAQMTHAKAAETVTKSSEKYVKTMQAELDLLGRNRAQIESYNASLNKLDSASLKQVVAIAKQIDAYHEQTQAMKILASEQDKASAISDKASAAAAKFIAQLKYEAETASLTTKELAAYKAAKLGVSDAAAPLIAAMKEGGHAMDGFSLSSSVAKRELLVMTRELGRGDFTKLGSSFSIFAQSSGLMAMAMTPLGLAIGAVAAAAGLAAVAFFEGSKESHAFTEAIINTGNYAGVTKGQLTDMSAAVAKTVGTQHEAADALAQLGATGRISGTDLAAFAVTAVHAAESSGVAIKDTVAEFVKLGQDPVKESARLNESMHYLTGAVFEQINSLVALGKTDEAATLAQKTYANAVNDRAEEVKKSLGYIERAFNSLTAVAKSTWSAVAGIGRPMSADGALGAAQAELAALQAKADKAGSNILGRGGVVIGTNDDLTRQEKARFDSLTYTAQGLLKKAEAEDVAAKKQRESAVVNEKSIDAQKLVNASIASHASATEKMNKELAESKKQYDAIRAANPNSELLKTEATEVERITASYAVKTKAQKQASDANGVLMASIAKANEAALLELSTDDKLSAADRFRLDMISRIDEALRKKNITVAQGLERKAGTEEAVANMNAAKAADEARKATEALTKAHDQYIGVLENNLNTTQADTDKLRQQTAELGLSKEAIQGLRAAEIDRQAAVTDGLAIDAFAREGGLDTYLLLVKQADAIRAKSAAMRDFGAAETAADQAKKIKDNDVKLLESVDKAAESAFINIAENGSNAFTKIGKTLKTAVLDLLYQLTIKKFIVNIVGSVTGASDSAISQAAGIGGVGSSLGSLFGIGKNISSIYSAVTGGGLGATASGLIGSGVGAISGGVAGNAALGGALGLGQGASAAAATAAAEAGGAVLATETVAAAGSAAALGTSLATLAGPVGLAIAAVGLFSSIFGSDGPSLVSTGHANASYDTTGKQATHHAFAGGSSAAVDASLGGMAAAYGNTADMLGIGRVNTAFDRDGYASSDGTGAHFRTYGGTENGKSTFNSGELASDPAAMTLAASRAVFAALQGSDLPRALSGLFDGLDVNTISQQQIDGVIKYGAELKAFDAQLQLLPFENLKNLSFDAAKGLIAASGGLQNLQANLGTYFKEFYSADEQRAVSIKQINSATAGSGLDAATATRDQFRKLVEAQDLTTTSGQKTYAALLTVAGAFSVLTPVAVAGAAAVEKVSQIMGNLLKERSALQANLLDAQGNKGAATAIRRTEAITGFSAAEIAAYDYNRALEAQVVTVQAATAAAAQTAQQRGQIEIAIMQLQGNAAGALAAQRANELAAMDESLRGLKQVQFGLEDVASAASAAAIAASAAAAAIAAAANSAAQTYFAQIDRNKSITTLTNDATSGIDKFFATTAASSNAGLDAANAALGASKTAAANWRGIASTIQSTLDSLRSQTSTLMGNGYESTRAQFASLSALAAGGDAASAGKLSGAASAFLAASDMNSRTLADYLRDRAAVENSLAKTMTIANLQATAQESIANSSAEAVTQLTAMNANLTGFSAQVYQLLQNGYKGADRTTATAAATSLATATADYANYFSQTKEGASREYNGGTLTRLAGDAAKFTSASGVVDYLRGSDSVLDTANRVSGFRDQIAKQYGLNLPSYDVGTNFVPKDMVAQIHEGEAIVPRAYNPAAGGGDNSTAAELKALRADFAKLLSSMEQGNKNTQVTAEAMQGQQRRPLLVTVTS